MSVRGIARRLGLALVGITALVAAVGSFARDPLQAFAARCLELGGLPGLGVLVALCDPVPGVGFQPALLLGVPAGVPAGPLFAVTAAGSTVGSVLSWAVGRAAGRAPPLRRLLALSGTEAALERWGLRALVAAAVMPLPYGLATLAWGAHGRPLGPLLLAAVARWLKVAGLLLAVRAGWQLTA